MTVLGAVGAALFYGDAILTPALSVLSAVEGLKSVPAAAPYLSHGLILALAIGLLVGLFAIQRSGTASVAKWFGPICVLWFIAIGGVGIGNLITAPEVLAALNPIYGVEFLLAHGTVGLLVEAKAAADLVGSHHGRSLNAIAAEHGRCRTHLGKLVALTCLAPDIVTAIIEGKHPQTLRKRKLLAAELPLSWSDQRSALGFAPL